MDITIIDAEVSISAAELDAMIQVLEAARNSSHIDWPISTPSLDSFIKILKEFRQLTVLASRVSYKLKTDK